MRTDRPTTAPEDDQFYYKNGESEAEKLMREHLNTPGHVITDEELRNLRVGVPREAAEPIADGQTERGAGRVHDEHSDGEASTPWDVIDP
ncbi:MAG: hypothetical protein JWP27_2949 [Flaviaesturariibacter sp.]|nr:hypothetical protein [Flaviaesturariibacter sp.]